VCSIQAQDWLARAHSGRDSRDMPNSARLFLTELAAYLKKDAEREQRDEEKRTNQ
jgi:hypothetical protein